MNNLKLREATKKLIKPCATCGGSGKNNISKADIEKTKRLFGIDTSVCSSCDGKGYIDELEFGCEVIILNKDNKKESGIIIDNAIDEKEVFIISLKQERTYCLPKHIFKNLGKPLELNELLEALGKKGKYTLDLETGNLIVYIGKNRLKHIELCIDLKLKPEQQSEEVLLKLIEILK